MKKQHMGFQDPVKMLSSLLYLFLAKPVNIFLYIFLDVYV